ncbi:MAG: tetrahydromethanopterin S-methyltransferase subunit A [Candidatus Nitrosotenuis sp.]
MNLNDIAGEICKIILPIHEDVFYGNPRSNVAVCTLSSMKLLKEIAGSDVLSRIALAGRLLSENKGIDALIRHVNQNENLSMLILCGKEVSGHRAGHSLLQVHKYGVDTDGRIVNSVSPEPVLSVSNSEIAKFQNKIRIIDAIGTTSLEDLRSLI